MSEASPPISLLHRADTRRRVRLEAVGALLLLAAADLLRALLGIDRFCRLLGRARVRRGKPLELETLDRIVAAFTAAAARYRRRDLALVLPAALAYRLRRAGIQAELVVGLGLFPLRAQTWVEAGGRRIGRAPAAGEPVRVLARY